MKASVGISSSTRSYTREGLASEQGRAETSKSSPTSEEKDAEQDETHQQSETQQQPIEDDDLLLPPLAHPVSYNSYNATTVANTPQPTHPINWFGLFPPSALRGTQNVFTTSVMSTVPEILSTTSQMRSLEDEIWKIRKELGLEGYDVPEQYQLGMVDEAKQSKAEVEKAENHVEKNDDVETVTSRQKIPMSPSKTQKLVSRSKMSEPRSRILKLD